MQVTFFFKVYFYFDIVRVAKREKKKASLKKVHIIFFGVYQKPSLQQLRDRAMYGEKFCR